MNMYTKPNYRNRGIATKLLQYLVAEAELRNCKKLTLNASQMGRPLYEKYGFKEVKDGMVYCLK